MDDETDWKALYYAERRRHKATVKKWEGSYADVLKMYHEQQPSIEKRPKTAPRKDQEVFDISPSLRIAFLEAENRSLREHVVRLQIKRNKSTKDRATQTKLAPIIEITENEEPQQLLKTPASPVRRRQQPAALAFPVSVLLSNPLHHQQQKLPLLVHRYSQTDESLLPP